MTCPEPELDDGLEVPFRLLPELPELDELELDELEPDELEDLAEPELPEPELPELPEPELPERAPWDVDWPAVVCPDAGRVTATPAAVRTLASPAAAVTLRSLARFRSRSLMAAPVFRPAGRGAGAGVIAGLSVVRVSGRRADASQPARACSGFALRPLTARAEVRTGRGHLTA